jgi:hypothetical protein
MEFLTERNQAGAIYAPVIKVGEQSFAIASDWTPAAGDVQYSVDGASFANVGTLPTHVGLGMWEFTLAAGEVNGERTMIRVSDANLEDQALLILTWGDDDAGLPLNALVDYWMNRNMATARASSRGDSTGRNPIQALGVLRHKKDPSGTQLIVRTEDDVTEDFRFTMDTDAEANPVTGMDPTT